VAEGRECLSWEECIRGEAAALAISTCALMRVVSVTELRVFAYSAATMHDGIHWFLRFEAVHVVSKDVASTRQAASSPGAFASASKCPSEVNDLGNFYILLKSIFKINGFLQTTTMDPPVHNHYRRHVKNSGCARADASQPFHLSLIICKAATTEIDALIENQHAKSL
jgi:hypothetical protein